MPPQYRSNTSLVDIVRIEGGTHLSAWTDPDSETVQARIAGFLATP